jgi:hypothetical protein
MFRILSLLALPLLLVAPARADEKPLNGAAIAALLSDQVMTGENKGRPWQQIFHKTGATFYTTGGAQSQGRWEVRGDQYCSVWPPSPAWACYDMVQDGEIYIFISRAGEQAPAKLLK